MLVNGIETREEFAFFFSAIELKLSRLRGLLWPPPGKWHPRNASPGWLHEFATSTRCRQQRPSRQSRRWWPRCSAQTQTSRSTSAKGTESDAG